MSWMCTYTVVWTLHLLTHTQQWWVWTKVKHTYTHTHTRLNNESVLTHLHTHIEKEERERQTTNVGRANTPTTKKKVRSYVMFKKLVEAFHTHIFFILFFFWVGFQAPPCKSVSRCCCYCLMRSASGKTCVVFHHSFFCGHVCVCVRKRRRQRFAAAFSFLSLGGGGKKHCVQDVPEKKDTILAS